MTIESIVLWAINLVITVGVVGIVRWVFGVQKDVSNLRVELAEQYIKKTALRETLTDVIEPLKERLDDLRHQINKMEIGRDK